MKYCVNCANPLEDGATACPNCGAAAPGLEESAAEAATGGATLPKAPKRQKTGIALVIGVPVAVVAIAALAVLAVLLFSISPMQKFERGFADFVDKFTALPANEMGTRMAAEPHDVSMTMDISGLSDLIPDAGPVPGGMTLKAGYMENKTEGGFRLAISSGGMDILRMAALVTDDKLLAGYSSAELTDEIGLRAASLKLKGKPGDSLMDRLEGLYPNANQEQTEIIRDKLLTYLAESADPKWFVSGDSSITDGLTGKTVQTKTASLELNGENAALFIGTLSDKLDKDPDFYNTYDKLYGAGTTPQINTRFLFKEMFALLSGSVRKGNFNLSVLVHFTGSTAVAIEMRMELPNNEGSMNILIQKTVRGDSTGYVCSMMAGDSAGQDSSNLKASLNVGKTAAGYSFDGKYSYGPGAQMSESLAAKGTMDIEKLASDQYSVDTKFNCNWSLPDSGSKDVDLEMKADVGFGAKVGAIQGDAGYMYSELSANATEAATLNEFLAALSSALYSGLPGID
jgi:hypothetical protein